MKPAAVLFDCDGVIVDSEGIGIDHLSEALAAVGLVLDRAGVAALFVGETLPGVARLLAAKGYPTTEDWVRLTYDGLYEKLAEGTPLIEGVEAVFEALDAAGIAYAIGSNGEMRKMHTTLRQHPRIWARVKDHLYSAQALGCPKPDPGVYLHAATALGVDPRACVVIDDSPSGCKAGVAGGIRTLGFAEHDDGAALGDKGAEVFHRMDALPRMLGLA